MVTWPRNSHPNAAINIPTWWPYNASRFPDRSTFTTRRSTGRLNPYPIRNKAVLAGCMLSGWQT